jgi:hypothetical protein
MRRELVMYAHVGDRLLVEGDSARTGLIIGMPHADGSPPYIVRWQANGQIAMVFPGEFARVIPASHPAGTALGQLSPGQLGTGPATPGPSSQVPCPDSWCGSDAT